MAGQDATLPAVDWLTLATLNLCNISYARDILEIPGLVLRTPPLTNGGLWTCLWGPVQSSDEANLAFVAGYSPQPGLAVQSICITIRGTDIYWGEDIWGILAQVWEDVDAPSQVHFPWAEPGDPVKIARGTRDGLKIITRLTDETGVSLTDFMNRFFGTASNSNVTTLVTGHSLGACLATVVAPWIEHIKPTSYTGDIQPITFAGPTAGNSAFATYYTKTFTKARRFHNTLDIIPKALENLPDVMDIYSGYGLDAPDLIWILVPGMSVALLFEEVTYVQPGEGTQLSGSFYSPDNDWYAQALHQHHPATYLSLLMRTPVQESAPPRSARRRGREARLAKLIGSAETAGRLVDEAVARLRQLAAART